MELVNQELSVNCTGAEKRKALMSVLHTSNLVKKHREAIFERFDVNQTKVNILQILFDRFPLATSQSELRDSIADKTIDLSRIIHQLDSMCLVSHTKRRNNRRVSDIMITRKGVQKLDEINKHSSELTKASDCLSLEEAAQLAGIMQKIASAVNDSSSVYPLHMDRNEVGFSALSVA